MVGRTKSKTKVEQERIHFVKHFMGCLPCLLVKYPNSHCDYHHVVEGQRRVGEMWGYGMCLWHHKGIREGDWAVLTRQEVVGILGPSHALSRKEFRAKFGTERSLVSVVDYAQKLFKKYAWNEFEMSGSIANRIWHFHLGKQ